MKERIVPSVWLDDVDGAMTLDAIQQRHQPAEAHRVRENNFLPGMTLAGSSRKASIRYAIEGACRFDTATAELVLRTHEFAELPAGDFTFEVLGEEAFIGVSVWRVPSHAAD